MATIQKGEDIYILLDDTAIECTTDVGMSMSADEIETTCKNSAGNKSFERGAKERTYSVSGNLTDGVTTNEDFKSLEAAFEAGTEFTIKWGGIDTGDTYWSQTVTITSLDATSGNTGTLSTWTASLKGSGARTVGTVA